MASNPRKRPSFQQYKTCPHCDKELGSKKFKEHKRLYFCNDKKKWYREDPVDDDTGSSDLSSISLNENDIHQAQELSEPLEVLEDEDMNENTPYHLPKFQGNLLAEENCTSPNEG